MSGTVSGGKLAAQKVLSRDPDFYKKIGSKGGKNSTTGGFASDKQGDDGLTGRQRAKIAGAKGGMMRHKTKVYNKQSEYLITI